MGSTSPPGPPCASAPLRPRGITKRRRPLSSGDSLIKILLFNQLVTKKHIFFPFCRRIASNTHGLKKLVFIHINKLGAGTVYSLLCPSRHCKHKHSTGLLHRAAYVKLPSQARPRAADSEARRRLAACRSFAPAQPAAARVQAL